MSWITVIFARFQGSWFNKWSTCIPNEDVLEIAKRDWGRALYGIPIESINRALDESQKTLEWPPSLAEFIKLCNRPQSAGNMPVWNDVKLPSPETVSTDKSRADAEEARAKMRKILNIADKQ